MNGPDMIGPDGPATGPAGGPEAIGPGMGPQV